ncbi:MAG: helix-turn-helix domain-containing protein [Bacteroidota bacterium]
MRAIETFCLENNIELTVPKSKSIGVVKKEQPKVPKTPTREQTFQLYQQGYSIAQIVEKRALKSSTITSHLAKLYEEGRAVTLSTFISKTEIAKVAEVVKSLEPPYRSSEIFSAFDGQMTYTKIHFALADLRKNGIIQ